MLNLSDLKLTNKGKEILYHDLFESGPGFKYSSVKTTADNITEDMLLSLEKFEHYAQSVPIDGRTIPNSEFNIVISNKDLSIGYKLKAIGIFVEYNGREVLYAACINKSDHNIQAYDNKNVNELILNIYLMIGSNFKITSSSTLGISNNYKTSEKIRDLEENVIKYDALNSAANICESIVRNLKTGHGFIAAGLPPKPVESFIAKRSGYKYTLTIVPPDDTIAYGKLLCSIYSVKIVRKEGSYPDNENDGVEISTVLRKDFYKLDGKITDTVPLDGKKYYYTAFPCSDNNIYCRNPKNNCIFGEIYGYDINIADSNPNTRVSYPTDVLNSNYSPIIINLTNGDYNITNWINTFFIKEIRPVMLKYNGEVDYELTHIDQTKKINGSPSDISNENYEGNAMVEFPKMYFKRWEDSTHQHVRIANYKVDDDYKCYQHMYDGKELEYIYLPMFAVSEVNGRIRSLAGKRPLVHKIGSQEKPLIEANGPGWQFDDWMNTCMIVDLLFLLGKSTDLQGIFGMGNSSTNNYPNVTGELMNTSMFYGSNDTTKSIKFFYMENYYGDSHKRKYGCISNSTRSILVKPYPPYSTETNNPSGYIEVAKFNGYMSGYISKTKMTEYGMIPIELNGGSTTYIPDYALIGYPDKFLIWGGGWSSTSYAGFYFDLGSMFSSAGNGISPSLSFKHHM